MAEQEDTVAVSDQHGAAEAPEQPTLPGTMPEQAERLALIEAIVYIAEDPLPPELIAEGLGFETSIVKADLEALAESYAPAARGVEMRKVAGGYKMFTKAEHHEVVRKFVKSLRPKLKLSLPALETLSVVAYKQPITLPEIQAIRGVNASGVIHTLLRHKLVATAGRKKVVGKPMMYKTTREFLIQFGLDDLAELPNLKELEELSRAALGEEVEDAETEAVATEGGSEAAEDDAASDDPQPAASDQAAETDGSADPSDSEPEPEPRV